MIVVSNTTPIISLSSIGKVDLLERVFGKITIPKAVYSEIKQKKSYGFDEIDKKFFEVRAISEPKYLDLLLKDVDIGEAEAILLSKELNSDILIIDERIGLDLANLNNIFCIGTLTVLKTAKDNNIIDSVKPLLDEMIIKGRYYSVNVYNKFLSGIGELN